MDTGLLIVSLVFFLIGIGLIVSAYKAYKKFKFFTSAQLQSIDYIKTGPVKIKGKIVADKTLSSPYSKKPCVYYRYRTISMRFKSATGGPSSAKAAQQIVASGENAVSFDVDDGTGRINVNAEGADIMGLDNINYYVSASNETLSLGERIKRLKEMGESDFKKSKKPVHIPEDLTPYDGSLHSSKYDYLFGDTYIPPNSEIVVVGSAERLVDDRLQIRKKPVMLIAQEDDLIKSNLSGTNTLRTFAVGIAMLLLGVFFIIIGK
jgi:hypothetical protein